MWFAFKNMGLLCTYKKLTKGKGCQGTCIKDTWTKPKGGKIEGRRWGLVDWKERWGEKGDNCT